MPPRKRRKSVLASWFGRKRRESSGSRKSNRISDSTRKDWTPRKLRDSFAVLFSSFRRIDTSALPGETDSLLSRIKDISVNSNRLDDRKAEKRSAASRSLRLSQRKNEISSVLRRFRRIAFSLPAVFMLGICVLNVFGTPNGESVRIARFETAYETAISAGNSDAVELLLLKNIGNTESTTITDRSRYLKLLLDTHQHEKARRFVHSIASDGSERSGELQILAAEVLAKLGLTDPDSKQEFENRLVIAVADPVTNALARSMLGRFYREQGDFQASEAILEPIRATERGCLELALLRQAQGHFGDIPTTLAPYLVRWRERWLAPKSQADIESSAEALILMNQESIVLETLDNPPVPVTPDVADKIRLSAVQALLDREFRSGKLRMANALDDIERHYHCLPCSDVWIEPILKLCSQDSPVREGAIAKRDSLIAESNCQSSFLVEFARQAHKSGDSEFAKRTLESALTRFPDDFESKETLARILLEMKPQNTAKARELIDTVLREHPERTAAIEVRGLILESEGNTAEALVNFRKALASDPRNIALHESIARACTKLGDKDQARIHQQLAQELSNSK
jgi:tetratricopeptide (TPR) repeat protein